MSLQKILLGIPQFVGEGIAVVRNQRNSDEPALIVWCNKEFSKLSGYDQHEVRGISPLEIHGTEMTPDEITEICDHIFYGKIWRSTMICRDKAGAEFWGDVSITPVDDEDDPSVVYFIHVCRDVSDLIERETMARYAKEEAAQLASELQATQDRLISAIDTFPDPFAIFDKDERLLTFNTAYASCWGVDPQSVMAGMSAEDLFRMGIEHGVFPESHGREEEWLEGVLHDVRIGKIPSLVEMPDGRAYKICSAYAPNADRLILRVDITESRRQQKALEDYAKALEQANEVIAYKAEHDTLTGLGNRSYLESHLNQIFERRRVNGGDVALLHVDLDRFKQINDTMGHAAGDHVLQMVAVALRGAVNEAATVARVGGDEFVIVMPTGGGGPTPLDVGECVVKELSQPVTFNGKACRFSASVGIAETPIGGTDGQALLMNSDIALYRAKRDGKARCAVFNHELKQEMNQLKKLSDEIIHGLETDAFIPVFQPQIDTQTMEVAGVEVLARWQHPERGVLPPDKFLSTAEELNVIADIDRMVFQSAIDVGAELWTRGYKLPQMSFNVSESRVRDYQLLEDVQAASHYPGQIIFELLESIFLDDPNTELSIIFDTLQEQGVLFEVDDFGSGRASIIGLTNINPVRLKIDRRLVAPIAEDKTKLQLVAAIHEIARALGIGVVSEGVETEAQARILSNLGSESLQGYLFAKPLSAADLQVFIQSNPWPKSGLQTPCAAYLPR